MARMLIIEPEVSLRTLLREALEQGGYGVVEAANSYEGLQGRGAPRERHAGHPVSHRLVT